MVDKKWIQIAVEHPGKLHKDLHVKEDKKIPKKKIDEAATSRDPEVRKRAVLAKTLAKMRKRK